MGRDFEGVFKVLQSHFKIMMNKNDTSENKFATLGIYCTESSKEILNCTL